MTASPTARKLAGSRGEVVGVALDEVLGVVDEPRVIGRDVVGHEVDEQAHATLGQRGSGGGEAAPAAEACVDLVAADAVGRADHVGVVEVGEGGVERRHLVGDSSASCTPAGLRSHTPISHTASTPGGVTRSHSADGTSASVAPTPARSPTSWSQAAVLSS